MPQSNKDLLDLKEKVFTRVNLDYKEGDDVQLTVLENRKKPGESIFVRADGKVGFSTINSIQSTIGDTIRGRIKFDNENCFFVEVNEVIEHASTEAKDS